MKLISQRSAALTKVLWTEFSNDNHVYALIDGAHDPRILQMIIESGHRHECLFEEQEAKHLAHAATFLVSLPRRHDLAGVLGQGLGRSWCSFLRSDKGFEEVLSHLRRYTKCRHDPGDGHSVEAYFAFWDPRVAADWFQAVKAKDAEQFFAPLESFWAEVPKNGRRISCYQHDGMQVIARVFALTVGDGRVA